MNVSTITHSRKFKIGIFSAFLLVSALAWFGMWLYGQYYVSTDDAYINANIVQIAPRISGKIIKIAVKNNQHVAKDQLLFQIDPVPFQVALNYAQAQVEMRSAELTRATNAEKRSVELVQKKFLSAQDSDNSIAALKSAQSGFDAAKANLEQAKLNMQYTNVYAPTSGWLTNFNIREGDIVATDQSLFALIDDNEFWADANFKETEMSHIKPGQSANIATDLYPDHKFTGFVESISGGAGSAFSLLPPQNATGNWVKVTQRVPVKVRIVDTDPNYPMRVGISANVTIYLQSTT